MTTQASQPELFHQTKLWTSLVARCLLDPSQGLHCAAMHPDLQELCLALGAEFQAQSNGVPVRGLAGLLPLLLRDCEDDLRRQRAHPVDQKVLLAAKLLWTATGPRGRRVALKAWERVWGWKVKVGALAG
jgi:hypothetical protein